MFDLWHVLLGLSLFFIACQLIGSWIDRKLDRASETIAERDSDWRAAVPRGYRTARGAASLPADGSTPEERVREWRRAA